jgi:hypothetical protein
MLENMHCSQQMTDVEQFLRLVGYKNGSVAPITLRLSSLRLGDLNMAESVLDLPMLKNPGALRVTSTAISRDS